MPRERRPWSDMRSDIREMLRETTAADSYWSDALLLILFNQQMDKRVLELAEQHEGWVSSSFTTNLVSGQNDYALLEGAGRINRVVIVVDEGTNRERERALVRDEQWTGGVAVRTATRGSGIYTYAPSYRVMGNLIRLTPAPNFAMTNGLRIDMEYVPDRLVNDADELDLRLPAAMETMLIFDAAVAAMQVEEAQGQASENYINSIERMRNEYAVRFFEYTAVRSAGFIAGRGNYRGD